MRGLAKRMVGREFREGLRDADIENGLCSQVGAMLRSRRWTPEKLASRAGVSVRTVRRCLNGEVMSVTAARRVASAFDVSLVFRFEAYKILAHRVENLTLADIDIRGGFRLGERHPQGDRGTVRRKHERTD